MLATVCRSASRVSLAEILRSVSKRFRKQDKNERDERESLLHVYMHALETGGAQMAQAA